MKMGIGLPLMTMDMKFVEMKNLEQIKAVFTAQ